MHATTTTWRPGDMGSSPSVKLSAVRLVGAQQLVGGAHGHPRSRVGGCQRALRSLDARQSSPMRSGLTTLRVISPPSRRLVGVPALAAGRSSLPEGLPGGGNAPAPDLASAAIEAPGGGGHLEQAKLSGLRGPTACGHRFGLRRPHAASETRSRGCSSPTHPQRGASSMHGTHHACRPGSALHTASEQSRTPSACSTSVPWQCASPSAQSGQARDRTGATVLVGLLDSFRLQDHMETSMKRG